mmetsp:Transcript_112716/g.318534  ORF Transcript_112716/g.318534 Transcript_112716/m.318534 type:complete len:220 (+) Transcript_112716:2378-3037(+)
MSAHNLNQAGRVPHPRVLDGRRRQATLASNAGPEPLSRAVEIPCFHYERCFLATGAAYHLVETFFCRLRLLLGRGDRWNRRQLGARMTAETLPSVGVLLVDVNRSAHWRELRIHVRLPGLRAILVDALHRLVGDKYVLTAEALELHVHHLFVLFSESGGHFCITVVVPPIGGNVGALRLTPRSLCVRERCVLTDRHPERRCQLGVPAVDRHRNCLGGAQ